MNRKDMVRIGKIVLLQQFRRTISWRDVVLNRVALDILCQYMLIELIWFAIPV